MKIGILTQPLHTNYGGIMQNWALQQVLKRMGHKPVCINRQHTCPPLTPINFLRNVLSLLKYSFLHLFLGQKQYRICAPWIRDYNIWTPRYADSEFVKEIDKTSLIFGNEHLLKIVAKAKFDAFIVGSDQVWRQEYSPRIETYFLDFLADNDPRPRIAYAASFGTLKLDIDSDKIQNCRRMLQCFDAVSVRERGGMSIVRNDLDRTQVEQVLDPTLLLDADTYRAIIKPTDLRTNPYIAAYILDDEVGKDAILSDIACSKGLPVCRMKCVPESGKPMPTVSQWLSNFANANFVVTDSFHGCAFSIIFNKPFVAIANAGRGADRFISLLEPLDLSTRLVHSVDEFRICHDTLMQPIDYTNVNLKLNVLKANSLNFLRNALA